MARSTEKTVQEIPLGISLVDPPCPECQAGMGQFADAQLYDDRSKLRRRTEYLKVD